MTTNDQAWTTFYAEYRAKVKAAIEAEAAPRLAAQQAANEIRERTAQFIREYAAKANHRTQ